MFFFATGTAPCRTRKRNTPVGPAEGEHFREAPFLRLPLRTLLLLKECILKDRYVEKRAWQQLRDANDGDAMPRAVKPDIKRCPKGKRTPPLPPLRCAGSRTYRFTIRHHGHPQWNKNKQPIIGCRVVRSRSLGTRHPLGVHTCRWEQQCNCIVEVVSRLGRRLESSCRCDLETKHPGGQVRLKADFWGFVADNNRWDSDATRQSTS